MDDFIRQQQAFADEKLPQVPWVERTRLTPLGDVAHHASLMAARKYLPDDLSTTSMLIVNCGSGVDTRFFQVEGTGDMTVTDISTGGLSTTMRYCPDVQPVLADTARLPFADNSFDVVGVRSGLHHLEDPPAGLAEMFRVCRVGCFFIEGHETPLVPVFVGLGMLEAEEEAGNKVYRYTRERFAVEARRLGASNARCTTAWFAQIPWLIRMLESIPGKTPALLWKACLNATNLFVGRMGNCFIGYLAK